MTSRKWYGLAPALVAAGFANLVLGLVWMSSDVEAMQRAVMPGSAEIALPAGDTTLYLERTSFLNGEVDEATGSVQVRCGVTDPAGAAVSIERPMASVSYTTGRHAGVNMFDLHVPTAGTYRLTCEAPSRVVLAVGRGVGTRIVVAVLGMFLGLGLGVAAFAVVLVRRMNQRRNAELGQAAVAR